MEGGSEKLHYQTRDGTIFYAAPPDSEDVGLEGFHAAEERAVLEFLADHEGGVLVMGGVSAVGKTYLLKNLAKREGLDYFDLQGMERRDSLEIGPDDVVQQVLGNQRIKSEDAKALVLDEGLVILQKNLLGLIPGMAQVIDKLRRRYSHIILAGGGNGLKSEMQSACLDFALPFSLRRRVHSFPLKQLNTLQTAEMIERARLDRLDPFAELTPDKRVHPDIARVVAELIIDYFRLMRSTQMVGYWVDAAYGEPWLYANLKQPGLMPQNCFELAWEKQREVLASRRDELMRVIEGNG